MRPIYALEWIEQFDERPCVPIDRSGPGEAWRANQVDRDTKISYWDGAILAAAEALARREVVVLAKIFSTIGQLYRTVRVEQPVRRLLLAHPAMSG